MTLLWYYYNLHSWIITLLLYYNFVSNYDYFHNIMSLFLHFIEFIVAQLYSHNDNMRHTNNARIVVLVV